LSSFLFIIKQQWTIEEIPIFSNSSHLEWMAELSDTILKWDYPRTIPVKVGLKPLNQIKANLAAIVLGWFPFNIVSDSPALHSKWLLLLKIEISLVVNFCFLQIKMNSNPHRQDGSDTIPTRNKS
jgi:hypothetical protein